MSVTALNAGANKKSKNTQRHVGKSRTHDGQQQQSSSFSLRKGGAAAPVNNNNNNNNRRQQQQKKQKGVTGKQEEEHYVVVITNVENDFAKIHQEALPRYCCLNEQHHHDTERRVISSSPSSSSPAVMNGGRNEKEKEKERRQCRYTVTARTETRSVEVAVYGKADADVSTVFCPAHASKKNPKKKMKSEGREENKKEKEEGSLVECVDAPAAGKATVFASLEEMVVALRHAPYFTHPPKFLLNVAGKEDGDVLRGEKSSRKRPRGGEDEEEKEKDVGGKPKTVVDARNFQSLLQSSVRQSEMITAVAMTSSRMHTKELREQLKDIPGFITCWMLYPQRFRVVFASKGTLFKAKELLDQFEVDSHVRVSLTLSEGTAKEFAEHLSMVESTA